MEDVIVEVEYTAYVETIDKKGFMYLEYGQGESLLFFGRDISDADFFESKAAILKELEYHDCDYTNIKFFKRRITTIIEIEETN